MQNTTQAVITNDQTACIKQNEATSRLQNEEAVCAICLQKKDTCIFFKRLLEEECAHLLYLMIMSQKQAVTTISEKPSLVFKFQLITAKIIQIIKQSKPVPDHYHEQHFPAHWETEANFSLDCMPVTLNSCVNYELAMQWLAKSATYLPRHESTHQLRPNLQIRQALESRRLPVLMAPVPLHQRPQPAPTQNVIRQIEAQAAPKAGPVVILKPLPVCSITLSVPTDPAQAVPCGHIFSNKAIKRWLDSNPNACCPNCRQAVTEVKPIVTVAPTMAPNKAPNPAVVLMPSRKHEAEALKFKQWLLKNQTVTNSPAPEQHHSYATN